MAKITKPDCSIRFRLREPNAATQTPIVCFVEYNGKPVIKIPTGLKIKPSDWLAEKEKPVTTMKGLKAADAHIINSRVSEIRHTVEVLFREHMMKFDAYPDKTEFREKILAKLSGAPEQPEEAVKDPSLINFIAAQITLAKSGSRVKLSGNGKGTRFAHDTIGIIQL